MHQIKSLCMVVLSTEGHGNTVHGTKAERGMGRQSMMRSRGNIGEGKVRSLIVVDMRDDEELEFIK
eukprot:13241623-Heterocapsa_arctica.AAC.1